jgi:hypothetical protein
MTAALAASAQCAAALAPDAVAAESLSRLHAAVDVAARLSVCFGVSILVTIFAPPLLTALAPHLPALLELLRALPRILFAACAAGLRAARRRLLGGTASGGARQHAARGEGVGSEDEEEDDDDEDGTGSPRAAIMDLQSGEALLFGAVCAAFEAARNALAALGAAAPAPPPCSARRAHVRPEDWPRTRF